MMSASDRSGRRNFPYDINKDIILLPIDKNNFSIVVAFLNYWDVYLYDFVSNTHNLVHKRSMITLIFAVVYAFISYEAQIHFLVLKCNLYIGTAFRSATSSIGSPSISLYFDIIHGNFTYLKAGNIEK